MYNAYMYILTQPNDVKKELDIRVGFAYVVVIRNSDVHTSK